MEWGRVCLAAPVPVQVCYPVTNLYPVMFMPMIPLPCWQQYTDPTQAYTSDMSFIMQKTTAKTDAKIRREALYQALVNTRNFA